MSHMSHLSSHLSRMSPMSEIQVVAANSEFASGALQRLQGALGLMFEHPSG